MNSLSYRHWGAIIGALLVIFGVVFGAGVTAIIVLVSAGGYFVGRVLEGDPSLQELQERFQRRGEGF